MPSPANSLVSIVIPCFNGAAFLREAINSALEQTYGEKEVIVVNDGSTDESPRILKTYGDRIRVVHQANAGLPAARNAGIGASLGSLVAFLDADDYWDASFLQEMVAVLNKSGADIAYCGWQNVGLSGGRGKPFVPEDYSNADKVELLLKNTRWPVHAAVIRKHAVTRVGCFDTNLASCEDFDLWLRVASSCRLVRVPEVLAFYRFHHGPQMTKNQLRIARDVWMIQRRFIEQNPRAVAHLSKERLERLTHGELLRRGYECYWQRDLVSARAIFRLVMRSRFGTLRDWKYMLPALLPLSIHRALVGLLSKKSAPAAPSGSSGGPIANEVGIPGKSENHRL